MCQLVGRVCVVRRCTGGDAVLWRCIGIRGSHLLLLLLLQRMRPSRLELYGCAQGRLHRRAPARGVAARAEHLRLPHVLVLALLRPLRHQEQVAHSKAALVAVQHHLGHAVLAADHHLAVGLAAGQAGRDHVGRSAGPCGIAHQVAQREAAAQGPSERLAEARKVYVHVAKLQQRGEERAVARECVLAELTRGLAVRGDDHEGAASAVCYHDGVIREGCFGPAICQHADPAEVRELGL